MRNFFRKVTYLLSVAAVSVPLMLSGQLVPKLGSQKVSEQKTEINTLVGSQRNAEGFLDPRSMTGQEQFSYIHNSFIPGNNPLKAASDATGIDFIGWVFFAQNGQGMGTDAHHGLYSFNLNDVFTPIDEYIGNFFDGGMAGLWIDGHYHYYYTTTESWPVMRYWHRDYNAENGWSWTETEITNEQMPRALCSNGELTYGCFFEGYDASDNPVFNFCKFDHETDQVTKIVQLPGNWSACAYGNDGYIYAIDKNGYLQKVNRETGEMTSIGYTGANPIFVTDAVIDTKSGRMFWAAGLASGYGKIFEIDLSTGKSTQLVAFNYGDQIVGLNILNQAWGSAPAAVENLKSNFANDSLTGTITFTAPTLTYEGNTLSGNLSYTLNVDGEVKTTGLCQPGQNVMENLTFTESGSHVISVYVSNENGDGPREIIRPFIGKDTPKTPEVHIAYENGNFNVSWNAVTETVNGGYMDPSKVTYKVTRMPDNVVVAEATKETSLVDPVAEPDTYVSYTYNVVASWDGVESGVGTSNIVGIGAARPPYRQEFATADTFDDFTVINANNDSETWNWYYTYVRIKYTGNKMDDWLISPALKLEAGKTYYVSVDAKCHNEEYPERLEIKAGKAPTVEGMTETVLGPTEIGQSYPWMTVGEYFTCPETGLYYFGIHGISDSKMFFLNIDNFSVGAGVGSESPAAVEDFKVVSDPSGEFNAVITGKAPTKTESDNELTSISKIDLLRNGSVIKTIAPIQPGEEFSYTDPVGIKGKYKYSAIVYNESGASREEIVETNIGFAVPNKVENVTLTETEPGKVTISWTAPTTDVEGTALGDSKLTYKIVNALSTDEVYAENVEGNTYTYTVTGDAQKFFAAGVYASNFAGESEIKYSSMIAAGNAYEAPYTESFAAGKVSSILGTKTVYGSAASWRSLTDGSVSGVNSSDGDNGYISCSFQYGEDISMLFSGKIDLSTAANPYFSVDFYNQHNSEFDQEDVNYLELVAAEANSDNWVVLKEGTFTSHTNGSYDEWVNTSADLSQFKGKVIQIGIRVTCNMYSTTLFDNIRVGELSANDLAVTSFNAPVKVNPNEEFSLNATVANKGYEAAEGYTVEFYRGTQLVSSVPGEAIQPKEAKTFTAKQTLGISDSDARAEYIVKVVFAKDENLSNNEAKTTVERKVSAKPAPANLHANCDAEGVHLTWKAPESGVAVTDTFDDETSWAYENVGDWTFVDADQGPIGGFEGIELPNNESYSQRAFFVFDNSNSDLFNETYAMHSGNKCLVSMFLFTGYECDDWAISPELNGQAQTISFWARSYSPEYPESIEMLYSVDGKEITDFVKVDENTAVDGEWTEFTFDVPEGAKYFAIRSIAADAFMLMIDDVSYTPAAAVPVGYNVYRDGVKLNDAPLTETEFHDGNIDPAATYKYQVTAVYANNEESAPSDITVDVSGIDSVYDNVTIAAAPGLIRINGAQGMQASVADVNGIAFFNGLLEENNFEIRLAPGIYIVRVEGKTEKIQVK